MAAGWRGPAGCSTMAGATAWSGATCSSPVALQRAVGGRLAAAAHAISAQAAEIGDRFGDPDLVTLARHGQGRALIALGRDRRGHGPARRGHGRASWPARCPPIVAGIVYCSVIEACQEIFDLRRAQEWTAALSQLVRLPAGPRPVPRSVPGASRRDHAAARRLAGRASTRRSGRASGSRSRRPPGGRRRLLPAGRAAPAARRVRAGRGGLPPGQPVGTRAAARAWRCCGWRRARSTPPRRRSAAWWTRPQDRRRALAAASRATSRSCSPPATSRAARAAADELSEIADDLDAPLLRALRRPRARGGARSPRATRAPRSARCAGPGRRGRSSRRPTRPRGSGS